MIYTIELFLFLILKVLIYVICVMFAMCVIISTSIQLLNSRAREENLIYLKKYTLIDFITKFNLFD